MIIAPPLWPKLPLPGVAFILEQLKKNSIPAYLFDINIDIYNMVKKDKSIKEKWTRQYQNFTEGFYEKTQKDHKVYFYKVHSFIKEKKITHAGFSIYKTNFLFSLSYARALKKMFPEIKIIFGGPHTAYLDKYNRNYFNSFSFIDHFIIGEGEIELIDLIKGSSQKSRSIYSSQISILSHLPFPKYELFDLHKYDRNHGLPLIASRGCHNNCSFCFEKIQFPEYYTRDANEILEEIRYHIKNNNIQWFTFYDSLFNGNLSNIEKLLKLLLQKKIKIIWDAQISIRKDMPDRLFELMKKSGCINLFIGLETGSSFLLKQMKKNFKTEDAPGFISRLKENDLNFELSLILNYPFETDDDFHATMDLIKRNKAFINKLAQVNPFIYYPGTGTDITKGYNFSEGMRRVTLFTRFLQDEGFKFTNAYINNLTA
ncbi:MAG: B12-binding domain-containing radical SAM protein [Spirochaetes bacterium]|nr:B12-binding domain-containing radical SAM protein [Spirochaetota bacterium]